MSKPLMIWQGGISGTWYATKAYRERDNGGFVCTGTKEDVTEQVSAAIAVVFDELIADVENSADIYEDDICIRGQGCMPLADWLRARLTAVIGPGAQEADAA